MICRRCDGLMIDDLELVYQCSTYMPSRVDTREMKRLTFHCVACGNWEDELIAKNRLLQRASPAATTRNLKQRTFALRL